MTPMSISDILIAGVVMLSMGQHFSAGLTILP